MYKKFKDDFLTKTMSNQTKRKHIVLNGRMFTHDYYVYTSISKPLRWSRNPLCFGMGRSIGRRMLRLFVRHGRGC
jgi:hypothetical protein